MVSYDDNISEGHWLRNIIRQTTVNLVGWALRHLPETTFLGAHLLISQLRQGNANLRGTNLEIRGKAGGNLRGSHILGLGFGARDGVEGDNHFGGRVGSQEIAVAISKHSIAF